MTDDQLPAEYEPFSFAQDVVTFAITDHCGSTTLGIRTIFTDHYLGDLFLVFGQFGTSTRNVLYFPYDVIAHADAVRLVMASIDHIYSRLGTEAIVEVYIVPPQGLRDFPPHQEGYFFNISTAPDSKLLFSEIDWDDEDHMDVRRGDAEKLVKALKLMAS